jgi:predicted enzyme related to lactoylglutathione lyase
MPELDAGPSGAPLWADLSARDTRIAARFYTALFGWTAEDLDPEADGAPFERSYRMTLQDGKVVAGIGPLLVEPAASAWSTYVGVTDLDETIARAKVAGGQVLNGGAKDLMGAGRLAVILDPSGASVSLWQPDQNAGAKLANEVRTSSWNELNTRDAKVSEGFYSTVFGREAEASGDQRAYTEWKLDGRIIGGCSKCRERQPHCGPRTGSPTSPSLTLTRRPRRHCRSRAMSS